MAHAHGAPCAPPGIIERVTAPSGYRIVDLPQDRWSDAFEVDGWAFAFAIRPGEEQYVIDCFEWSRGRGIEVADAERGVPGELAAVHSSFEFHMRVPGDRVIPTAGLTWVGVHQGHRRRGLLTAMIDDHFERCLGRGEAVSILYAAEPAIYQRFGYGLAARDQRVKMGRKPDLRPVVGSDELRVRLETVVYDTHAPIIAAYQAAHGRPGSTTHVPESLMRNTIVDAPSDREDREALRFAGVYSGDELRAWAIFRRKGNFEDWEPKGEVWVPAWGAADAAAEVRLWGVLTDFDLMVKTHGWLFPLDSAFTYLLIDERSVGLHVRDNIWLRVLDVKAALEGRGYEADADVAIALTDKQRPENAGTWRVKVAGGSATVTKDDAAAPDLAMAIQELGAVYLGGTLVETLVAAGLVTESTAGAARALSDAMRSRVAPVCNIAF